MSMCEQHYSLRWNDYTVKLVTAFQSLRDEEDFLDVTLACDGHQYSAHKMVLSACSPFFRTLLKANPCQHPIVILKDVGHIELERLLEFMYNGEVNIAQDQLAAFLKTAENLKIRGLAGSSDDSEQSITRDASLGNLTSSESLALSGHSSPFATYSAGQGPSSKDCNMSTEGDAYTRTDSPASKKQRKLNSSNMHLEDSISSQNADTLVSESGSEVDPLSVSATSLMCEGESRAERRELKVEPPEGTNDSYGDSMKLGHAHQIGDDPSATYPVAVAGPSGLPMISQDGVGAHEQGGVSDPSDCDPLLNNCGIASASVFGTFSNNLNWTPPSSTAAGNGPSSSDNQCVFCFKSFSNRGSMTRHLRDQHLQPGATVTCDVCGKVCKNRNCLITHRSVAHSGRKRIRSVSTSPKTSEKQVMKTFGYPLLDSFKSESYILGLPAKLE